MIWSQTYRVMHDYGFRWVAWPKAKCMKHQRNCHPPTTVPNKLFFRFAGRWWCKILWKSFLSSSHRLFRVSPRPFVLFLAFPPTLLGQNVFIWAVVSSLRDHPGDGLCFYLVKHEPVVGCCYCCCCFVGSLMIQCYYGSIPSDFTRDMEVIPFSTCLLSWEVP